MERTYIQAELHLSKPFNTSENNAHALLKKLKAKGYQLHLISNNVSTILVEEILKKCKLNGMFDSMIISSAIGYRKPHPKFARAMLKASGANRLDALLIGDRLTQDHMLANHLGMPSVFASFETHKDNQNISHVPYTIKINALSDLETLLL